MPSRRQFTLLAIPALSLSLFSGHFAAAASPTRESPIPPLIVVNHSDAKLTEIRTSLGTGWSSNRLDTPLPPGGRVEFRNALARCDTKVKVVFEGGRSRVFDVDVCTDGELVVGLDIPDMPANRLPPADGKDNAVVPGHKPKPLDDNAPDQAHKPRRPGDHRHEVYRL